MRLFTLTIVCISILSGCCRKEQKPLPLSGNPIFEGWYADPEIALFDSIYWVFPTASKGYEEQVYLDAFSSPDLVNWTKHEHVLDTAAVKWVRKCIWAPSIIEKGGKYYLFFGGNDLQRPGGPMWDPKDPANKLGGIGVAVADTPGGPYKDYLGKPLVSTFYNDAQPIDQFVFKYKDDYLMVYGGWGRCNLVRLKEDFTDLIPFDDGDIVKEITPKGYVEGPVMFERDGKWYFMWSEGGWGDSSYKVAYATAETPFGPFERLNTVLEQDTTVATGAGHHSVLRVPNSDDWYIFYHRRPIPNEHRDHRVTCVDRMYFNEDGTIQPVKMTFEGVEEHFFDPKAKK